MLHDYRLVINQLIDHQPEHIPDIAAMLLVSTTLFTVPALLQASRTLLVPSTAGTTTEEGSPGWESGNGDATWIT